MRTAVEIQNLWDAGGPFIGDNKPSTRVTVEPDWFLNKTGQRWGAGNKGPYRWWQREDNSQVEIEIPNIKSVRWERSIDQDVATCQIDLYNQWMNLNGVRGLPGELGNPGYFTADRGVSPESQARWDQTTNSWEGVLVPNALLRTYQGYGGHDETIEEAVAGGKLQMTGVWLVDDVKIASSALLNLQCRDMGKLLADQQLFPPLIPSNEYPLKFCRYDYEHKTIVNREIITTSTGASRRITYGTCAGTNSGSDVWYGENGSVHGHRPSHAFDNNAQTYWLSVGNSTPTAPFAVEWIEMCTGGADVNEIYIHPWAGNYQCFVSVMERGRWVRGPTIRYDAAGVGRYTGANTANVPYVHSFGVPWEQGKWYRLKRVYKADKIRLTFTRLHRSGHGPFFYRAGVRTLKASFNTNQSVGGTRVNVTPIISGSAPYPVDQNPNGAGYWQLRNNGQVFAFGDARTHPGNTSTPVFSRPTHGGAAANINAIAINATPSGQGYWVMHSNGRMLAYGDAEHYGDLRTAGINSGVPGDPNATSDFAPTPSGLGYWILRQDGEVSAFGDAVDLGGVTVTSTSRGVNYAESIEAHVSGMGYWILRQDGNVDAFGTATDYGEASPNYLRTRNEYYTRIRRTSDGTGYWIVSGSGRVVAKGSAEHFGEDPQADTAERWAANLYWDLIPYWQTDGGYALPGSFDTFLTFGPDWEFFGSVEEGVQVLRKDGNYKDYADIIKILLLWSGWLLYQDPEAATPTYNEDNEPPVYGNIESTGAFSKQCLPDDMFDKKPVIDPITQIKETVGYLFWIDEEGAAHFETPNWWAPGNYHNDTGEYIDTLPIIDERVNMSEYSAGFTDKAMRSELIISTEDPTEDFDKTITTRFVPFSVDLLRGMCKPAMWVNGIFQEPDQQKIMAELIAMHIWFSKRQGSVTCAANPNIQINDQVRIYERQTSETHIHYVRGVACQHDLDSGRFDMTLTTHWLGDQEDWSIVGLGTVMAEEEEQRVQDERSVPGWDEAD